MTQQELIKPVKESQTQRVLHLLKVRGRVTNFELNRICYRYSARILELRKEGHLIVTNQLKPGLFEYVYKGQKENIL